MTKTTDPTSAEERSLLEAAQASDEQAFGQLVEPYRRALTIHSYRMLGSRYDAEDIVQEDAALRMPPQPSVLGALGIATFFRDSVAGGDLRRIRLTQIRANGGPAVKIHLVAPQPAQARLANSPLSDQTTGGPMTSAAPHTGRWRAFALLAVSYFMTIIDLTIVNVSLPTIGRDLHFSPTNLQWVVTAYALTFGGLLLLGGRAADLLGRRRVMLSGLALFTVASLACALATGEGFLIASRAVQGVGAAIMLPAALSIVMHMFPEGAERNKALGIWGGLGAGGATVGLIAGGFLTRYAGWHYIFYLNVPIGAAALALAPRIVPDIRAEGTARRFDALGAIVGTGGLVLLVDAVTQAPGDGWGSPRTLALLAASLVLVAAFLMIERRSDDPVLPLTIFRLRTLAGANVAGLSLTGSFYAFIFLGSLYMQQVLHYSALQTGLAWLAASLTSIALAGVAQLLVTRRGPKLVMAAGMTLIGSGILWATRIPVHGHFLADLAGPMAVAGAGTAFAFIPISIAALTGIADRQAGLASGLLSTSQQLGGAIGIAIATSIAAGHTRALLLAGHDAPTALTGGYQHALWGLGAVALLALPAIFVLVGRDRPWTDSEIGLPEASPALAGSR